MIAINPEKLNIEKVQDENANFLSAPEMGATAYYRISREFRDFLINCNEMYGVIGFEYDFEDGNLNFGVVLKKDEDAPA